MEIKIHMLTENTPKYRPGIKLASVDAFVVHWVEKPGETPESVRSWFSIAPYACSAHFSIGTDGSILQMIPETEIAWHCGSAQVDPVSKRLYTDLARFTFGDDYCQWGKTPNYKSIGIEMNHLDWSGKPTEIEEEALVWLLKYLTVLFGKKPILTHRDVVGWKDCHKWYIENKDEFEKVKRLVYGSS